jgi:uncharacterized protein with von Willebrand factor type A (vWA) domain
VNADRDLRSQMLAFCTVLREEHGFGIGHAVAYDALRALEVVGITDRRRVRTALRLVYCGRHEEAGVFDDAFDAFFDEENAGTQQSTYTPRHSRPDTDAPSGGEDRPTQARPERASEDPEEGEGTSSGERRVSDDQNDDATAWQMLRAKYSPSTGAAELPPVTADDRAEMLAAAGRLIASLRLGRSRRWRPLERGMRFDLRRTLRASLQTGGDPVHLRRLGHPLRNPRFVVLVDGSRSMQEYTAPVVRFASALTVRSPRANVFVFSTDLRDVTRTLRAAARSGEPVRGLGEAWGGGTRIGASLDEFVRRYGWRLLSDETVVFVFSDGLDVGDITVLENAMRDVSRRSAAVVWLNPHLDSPGYTPSARGMRAALPYINLLTSANDTGAFRTLAKRVARTRLVR